MRVPSRIGWFLLFGALLPICLPNRCAAADDWSDQLRKHDVEANGKAVETFLQSLLITPEFAAKVRQLVVDLGSDRFQTREKATAELIGLPPAPQLLARESADKDLETRHRVRQILATPRYAKFSSKVLLVLRFIEEKGVKGLTPLL